MRKRSVIIIVKKVRELCRHVPMQDYMYHPPLLCFSPSPSSFLPIRLPYLSLPTSDPSPLPLPSSLSIFLLLPLTLPPSSPSPLSPSVCVPVNVGDECVEEVNGTCILTQPKIDDCGQLVNMH